MEVVFDRVQEKLDVGGSGGMVGTVASAGLSPARTPSVMALAFRSRSSAVTIDDMAICLAVRDTTIRTMTNSVSLPISFALASRSC